MKASIENLLRLLGDQHEAHHGIPESEIEAKERELGFSLPLVLRNYYKALGRSPHITQGCNNQYEPLPLEKLFIPDSTFSQQTKHFWFSTK